MASAVELEAVRPMTFEPLDTQSDRDVGRLLITCADRPGICAAICSHLYAQGANIVSLQQHTTDPEGGRLFLRVEFILAGLLEREGELADGFAKLAGEMDLDWRLSCAARIKRIAIMVSKADHALQELLWRRKAGDLRADIALVISNHDHLRRLVETWGIPFHHVPLTADTKQQAEEAQLRLLLGNVDTVVLARYMQVLSPRFLAEFPMQAINIHHSFLPAFVGADPYGRAAERGVKLIGATAHYVTEELDAGPIIEQDVARIDHRQSVSDLRRAGRYVERAVLARAVSWHVEDRVIVHGNKTIVFT
jgi:formyltetrahydrofolate deformylase